MKKIFPYSKLLLPLLLTLLASCSIQKKSIDLSGKMVLPQTDSWQSIKLDSLSSASISKSWWEIFNDNTLDSIMIIFLQNNYDLKIAFSSLEASKAIKKINGSDIFPNVDIALLDANSLGIGASFPPGTYGLNLSSSWEVDIWGKSLSKRFSANKEYKSSESDYEYLKFSIISQAVKMYFNLVESKEQENLARSSVDALQDIYNIVEERYNQGVRSSLDYRLALSNLLLSKSTLEQRKMFQDNLVRQMEIQIGVYPSGNLSSSSQLSTKLPDIPPNLPSGIIENRPDIISSYNKLESAKYNLDYSKKVKLPTLYLTDFSGVMSSSLEDLLDGEYNMWNLGKRIALPIFQSGKIRANKELSESLYDQAEVQYIYTVLKAFSEIENKLSSGMMLERQLDALSEAYIQSEEAYSLAKDRYENGLADLITVLDSQKRMFDTKGQMISIRKFLIENRIDLLICLGGSFSGE